MPFPEKRSGLRREVRKQEAVLRRTAGASDEAAIRERGIALWRLGEVLFRLSRFSESAVRFDQAVSELWKLESLRGLALHARFRQSNALAMLGQDREALVLLDRIADSGFDVPEIPSVIPDTLTTRMLLLERIGRFDDAQAAAEALIDQLGSGESQDERKAVVSAYAMNGRISESRGDLDDALAAYDEVAASTLENGKRAATVSKAMVQRAAILEKLGRIQDAFDAYDDVLVRFGAQADSSSAQNAAATAREEKRRLAGLLAESSEQ